MTILLTNVIEWLAAPATVSAMGVLVVLAYAMYNAGNHDLDPMIMYWAGVWGVLGALIGGRVLVLIFDPTVFQRESASWSLLIDGSRGVMGAFIGSMMAGMLYLHYRKVNVMCFVDIAVPAVCIGYFVTRIGCYLNGDDFGSVTNIFWAVQFAEGTDAFSTHLERSWITANSETSLPVHPTQLYHAVVGLCCFVLLIKWQSRWPGEKLAIALFIYGLTRFIIQFYRDDHLVAGADIDHTQWFCLLFISLGIGLWAKNRFSSRNKKVGLIAKVDA